MIPHESKLPASTLLARLRRNYTGRGLAESDAPDDPMALFSTWLYEAVDAELVEPNAMILATCGPDGRPSARTVLLKNFDAQGLVFFSNYASRKGRELDSNPQASLLFLWKELERQIRVDGTVRKLSATDSDLYFESRPYEARIGALASPQSAPIPSRAVIEEAFARLMAEHQGKPIARPAHWGGYRLKPDSIEFWQGRPNRLHDRLLFSRAGAGWTRQRLAP